VVLVDRATALAVTNILGSGTEKILVTASRWLFHMTEEKIDVSQNFG
jgi:hypothetical protein